MKRIIAITFILLIVLITLSACNRPTYTNDAEIVTKFCEINTYPNAKNFEEHTKCCNQFNTDRDYSKFKQCEEIISQNVKKSESQAVEESSNSLEYDEETTLQLIECKKNSDAMEKAFCIRTLAVEKENEFICAEISTDTIIKNNCYNALGTSLLDVNICNKITSADFKDNCLRNIADTKIDLKICALIKNGEIRDGCYLVAGSKLNDASVCNKIEDSEYKESCYEDIK